MVSEFFIVWGFIIIDDLISDALVLYWEYEESTKKQWKLAWNPWFGLETLQLRAHRYLA